MSASSSSQASQKKKLGHAEETMFNVIFGHKKLDDMNFSGASEDNLISSNIYKKEIENKLGKLKSYTVSLKSGVTWQFHLGRIDELSPLPNLKVIKTKTGETKVIHSLSFKQQELILKSKAFWIKRLKKGELLCYINQNKKYTFFKMDAVIDFICKRVKWRILETGRLKGDIQSEGKKYSILTFEYRVDKKMFALGAMGGESGLKFFNTLIENINYCEIDTKNKVKIGNKNPNKHLQKDSIGIIGQIEFDENYLYLCIGVKKWKRVKFSPW
jgi:thiamine pyrophosphokinase